MPLLRNHRESRMDDQYTELPSEYEEEYEDVFDDTSAWSSSSDLSIPQVLPEDVIQLAGEMMRASNEQSGTFSFALNTDQDTGDREIIMDDADDDHYLIRDRRNGGDGGSHFTVRINQGNPPEEPIAHTRRPLWMDIADFLTVSLFLVVVLRLIRGAFSVTSFSDDILQDTFDYVDGSTGNTSDSLIAKFGAVIEQEFPTWGRSSKVAMTIMTFYPYTFLSSAFLIASIIFSMLCFGLSVGKRWQAIQRFFTGVIKDGEGCF